MKWDKFKKIWKILLDIAVITLSAFLVFTTIYYWKEHFSNQDSEQKINYKDCNVALIKVRGKLISYINKQSEKLVVAEDGSEAQTASEDVVRNIENADKDNDIKAIIAEVDSFGGYPIAGEEISNALKTAKKPTVALIRTQGTSAAYYVATGAQKIFASAVSDIGGIGVTMSYKDNASKNQQEGYTYNQLSVGKFKDAGDSDKLLTKEEKDLFMRDIKITHDFFISAVARNRNLDIEKVRQLADGSSMMGQMALENGLIDRIGDLNNVKKYLEEKIGEEITICK